MYSQYSCPDSWPKSGLPSERGASPQGQVHNLDLKAAPPAPQQTEQQPGMGYLPRIIHSANVLQLGPQGSLLG